MPRCEDCKDVAGWLPWAQKGDGNCRECLGTGANPDDPLGQGPCRKCGGSGVCPTCDGEGWIGEDDEDDEDDEGEEDLESRRVPHLVVSAHAGMR